MKYYIYYNGEPYDSLRWDGGKTYKVPLKNAYEIRKREPVGFKTIKGILKTRYEYKKYWMIDIETTKEIRRMLFKGEMHSAKIYVTKGGYNIMDID